MPCVGEGEGEPGGCEWGGSQGALEAPPDLLHPEDGGETGCGLRPEECEGGPGPFEDGLREETEAPGAAAQGRGGEAVDVFARPAGALQRLGREAVGGVVVALRAQADCPDRGLWGRLALAAEWQRRKPGLTQWGHARAPFVSGRVVCRSKGGQRKRQGSSTADIGGVQELPRQRLT